MGSRGLVDKVLHASVPRSIESTLDHARDVCGSARFDVLILTTSRPEGVCQARVPSGQPRGRAYGVGLAEAFAAVGKAFAPDLDHGGRIVIGSTRAISAVGTFIRFTIAGSIV